MIGHLLNTSVTVYRATYTDDGRGGRIKTMTSQGARRAKVDQPSATERAVAAQEGATLTHVVHMAYGADVQRGDELDTGGTRRLRVLDVVSNSRATYDRLECQVVQGG